MSTEIKNLLASPITKAPAIVDETEVKSVVVVNARSYEVPEDVAQEIARLRGEVTNLHRELGR
jgi:hypothetical protein